MESLLRGSPLAGLALWIAVYAADSYLTVLGAREYKNVASEYYDFDGSYELNPIFEKDIDELRWFSPTFFKVMGIWSLLYLSWYYLLPRDFAWFMLGLMVLGNLSMVPAHLGNLISFRLMGARHAMEGHIKFARSYVLTEAAGRSLSYALLYGVLAALAGSLFMAGGMVGALLLAARYRGRARRASMDERIAIAATLAPDLPPPGWYADPHDRFPHRYWDGSHWTEYIASGGTSYVDQYWLSRAQPADGADAPTRTAG